MCAVIKWFFVFFRSAIFLAEWLLKQKVKRVTLLLQTLEMKKTIERWDFTIEPQFKDVYNCTSNKLHVKIRNEIHNVLRELNTIDLLLPKIEETCTIELVVHTNDNDTGTEEIIFRDFQREAARKTVVKGSFTKELKSVATGVHKLTIQTFHKPVTETAPSCPSKSGFFIVPPF